MTTGERWAGWIRFGGLLMLIIATLDFFEGLIAIIRSEYYVRAANEIIVFDTTTWGWIMLVWGIVVGCAGFGLLAGATCAATEIHYSGSYDRDETDCKDVPLVRRGECMLVNTPTG